MKGCNGMDDKLRYFCTVAHYENMTRAAEELHITQPALSSAMARLEKEIGAPLFVRTKNGLRLSEAGKLCLPYAQIITRGYTSMMSAMEVYLTQSQVLRIGSGMQHVASIVNDYMHDYPESLVYMVQYFDYHAIKQALLNREVDIVLCAPPIYGPGIKTHVICKEGLGLVMSTSNPLAKREQLDLQDLNEQRIIVQPQDFPIRVALEELLKKNNISLHYSMQAENSAIMDMFRSGLLNNWVVFYPSYRATCLVRDIPGLAFVPIAIPDFSREIAASCLSDTHLPRKVHHFLQYTLNFYKTTFSAYAYLNSEDASME